MLQIFIEREQTGGTQQNNREKYNTEDFNLTLLHHRVKNTLPKSFGNYRSNI